MKLRPGANAELKIRIGRLSADALRALNGSVMRDCADLRVTRAVDAGLRDPKITAKERRELLKIAQEIKEPEAVDASRVGVLRFRATALEIEQVRNRAAAAGMSLSDYLRRGAGID